MRTRARIIIQEPKTEQKPETRLEIDVEAEPQERHF